MSSKIEYFTIIAIIIAFVIITKDKNAGIILCLFLILYQLILIKNKNKDGV